MKTPKLNRDWHHRHVMPEAASVDERVKWHLEHAKQCGCRPIPATVLQEMTRSGVALPSASRGRTGSASTEASSSVGGGGCRAFRR
jgi:hypothetical protein